LLIMVAISAIGGALQAQQERRELTQAVEQSLSDAETAIEAGDLELARKRVEEANEQIADSRHELRRLSAVADHLSEKVARRIKEQKSFVRFTKLAKQIIDGAEEFSAEGNRRSSETIREALAIYGVLEEENWHEQLSATSLSAAQIRQIKEQAYELLLSLAYAHWEDFKIYDHSVPEESLRVLSIAASFHEPTRGMYWLRGEFQEALGQAEEAEESRQLMNASEGVIAADYFFPARDAAWNDESQESFQGYEAALRIQPNHFKTLFFYGLELSNSGNVERATDLYRTCVALNPNHSLALKNLGQVYYKRGDYEVAAHWLRKAFESEPDSQSGCRFLSETYERLGRYKDAVGVFDELIALKGPTWRQQRPEALASVHLDRARVAGHWLRYEEALRDVEKAIELDPDNIFVLMSRRSILQDLGRFDEALAASKATEISAKEDRHRAQILSERSRILCELGQYQDALQVLNEAMELGPNEGEVYQNAAVVHATYEHESVYDPELAVNYAKRATELHDTPSDYFILGLAQFRNGNASKAVSGCDQVLSKDHLGSGLHRSAHFLKAMAQWQLGEPEAARESYKLGVEWDQSHGVEQDEFHLRAEAEQLLEINATQSGAGTNNAERQFPQTQ